MELSVTPGKYVVAVSGGVDSIVLLDLLTKIDGLELVVAHFDHGIRDDSASDAQFVADAAWNLRLPFVMERVELGQKASENAARDARYTFLRRVVKEQGAQAVLTAHHQDDLLETAIFNMLRGTGRRGLTSLKSTNEIVRPLLNIPKNDLINYALKRKLSWREDSTNHDERYSRNYIRHRLLVKFDDQARQQLLAHINRLSLLNGELDHGLGVLLEAQKDAVTLDRTWFKTLPQPLAREIMASWLRSNAITDYDAPTLERLVTQSQQLQTGKRIDVRRHTQIRVTKEALALELAER